VSRGASVGDLRLVEDDGARLVLAAGQWFEKLLLLAGAGCLILGLVRLAAPEAVGAPRVDEVTKDWGFILLCVGFAGVMMSFRTFRRSWEFDGRSGVAKARRGFMTHTFSGIDGIGVRVGHLGPNEILVLVLEMAGVERVVAHAPANARGLALPAVGRRIAEVLRVPLSRAGAVVQSGDEVRAALDGLTTPAEVAGAAPLDAAEGWDGRDIRINCPACGRRGVQAVSYEHAERSHGISHTTYWVKCLACGTSLYSKAIPEELIGRTPEELEKVIVLRVSLVARVTAVLSIVLCIYPWVGLAVAMLATALTWRTRGWQKTLSRVALSISLLFTVAATVLLLVVDRPK
jgi:hypothetical protein